MGMQFDAIRRLMGEGHYSEALAALNKFEATEAQAGQIEFGKGLCLTALGRVTEARAMVSHLKEQGHVALAQRLAQRMSAEDPIQLEPIDPAEPARPNPYAQTGSPNASSQRYVMLALGAVVLLLGGVFIGTMLDSTRGDSARPAAAPAQAATSQAAKATSPPPPVVQPASNILTGSWTSVDFVAQPEAFRAGQKSFPGNLFLKNLDCFEDGRTSLGYTWHDGWMTHKNGHTRAAYYVKTIDGQTYLFLPWLSGDVTDRGMKPKFYVLVKSGAQPRGFASSRSDGGGASFRSVVSITTVSDFDDVRWKDMAKLNLAKRPALAATLWFNEATVWPPRDAMAPNCDPKAVLTEGMNPGLGVRTLHREGITGKGVSVAIIDQPLYQDHPEFKGKIAAYYDTGCGSDSSMHGPAVTSLLVGEQCGTAPGARVYYAAVPSWKKDSAYFAKALDWVMEQNEGLKQSEKIRVVSVSAAPSGRTTPFTANTGMWDAACARAEANGILVLDCTSHRGIISSCYFAGTNRNDLAALRAGYPGMPGGRAGHLLVPTSPRTSAEEYEQGKCGYQYTGRGGLSWAIPYCAGVLALAWQVRPDVTANQMQRALFASAYVDQEGNRYINPGNLIRLAKTI